MGPGNMEDISHLITVRISVRFLLQVMKSVPGMNSQVTR